MLLLLRTRLSSLTHAIFLLLLHLIVASLPSLLLFAEFCFSARVLCAGGLASKQTCVCRYSSHTTRGTYSYYFCPHLAVSKSTSPPETVGGKRKKRACARGFETTFWKRVSDLSSCSCSCTGSTAVVASLESS